MTTISDPAGQAIEPRRGLIAWCFYDWANSAFPTVIVTFVFATYFTQGVAETEIIGTSLWSRAVAISAACIAILSPILGAIADRTGRRKPWVAFFSVVCIACSMLLWFTKPDPAYALWGLVLFAVANAAFEIGGVFYNAMLPPLAHLNRLGRWSGWGWGLGYLGGLSCLIIAYFGLVQPETPPFGLDRSEAEHIRAVTLLVALWFAVFAIPMFVVTPDEAPDAIPDAKAVRNGLRALVGTIRRAGRYRNILWFLVARLFYVDGMNTMFAFGAIYAAGTFRMDTAEILQFGIALNVSAGIGAFSLAWVDDLLGSKRTIQIALLGLIGFGLPLLLVEDKLMFWLLAVPLGLFMGPAQAASRSMMGRLAPPELRNEMFGLLAMSGKATAFAGPAMLGYLTVLFDSQRAGMAIVLVLLAIGFLLLLPVRERRATYVPPEARPGA